ncbi:MAG: hypothetical protein M1831_002763 [Alyxoria varia]|nr:MAG: hypothetical protein M1831_002763 [Alyxoria varia]
MEFLKLLDESLPNHFLCAGCLIYQRRSDERLEHPHCFREAPLIPRLVNVNFNLVQSHMRASNLGLQYGRKVDDNKTLKKKISPSCHDHPLGYSYRIRSAVLDGHLLLRTDSSKAFQSPMEQDLWNVVQWLAQCTHFYDEVEDICRCALGHARNGNGRIVQCDNCLRPRRCHSCASEYIIRVTARCHPRTEYILSVTRWTDLGNGKIPWYGEWDAASRIGVRRIRRDTVYDLQGLPCVRSRFEGKGSPTGSDVSDKDPEPLYTEPIPLQDIDDGVLPRVVCKIATFDWETRTTVRNKGVPKLLPRPEGDT